MMRRMRPKGFTLIELLVSVGLLMIFVAAVWHIISRLALASGHAGRDAVELSLAVRMSARFRDDVRQALGAKVSADESSILLVIANSTVEYRRGTEGRMERVEGEQIDVGPLLKAAQFDVNGATRLVHSQWVCGEAPEIERPSHLAQLDEHVLILNTAMRSSGEKEKPK